MLMTNILLLKNFKKSTSQNVTARLNHANLASKSDIVNFLMKIDLDKNELTKL